VGMYGGEWWVRLSWVRGVWVWRGLGLRVGLARHKLVVVGYGDRWDQVFWWCLRFERDGLTWWPNGVCSDLLKAWF